MLCAPGACIMSALGQKRTWSFASCNVRFTPKADIGIQSWNVRFVPEADMDSIEFRWCTQPHVRTSTNRPAIAAAAAIAGDTRCVRPL